MVQIREIRDFQSCWLPVGLDCVSSIDPKIIRPLKTIPEHFSFEVWTVRSASNHATKWSEDHRKNRDHLMYR